VDTHTNYISLYTGAGGLDLGFKLAVPSARTICYVERDAAASALLVDHMQANQLDDAPLWSDSATFDCKPWIGSVDFIIGGFPCQPWSAAGKRKGTEDERWLWPHIFRLVREIRPSGVFLENVTGLLSGGIEHVLGDLAAIGYDAEWTSIRASDIGAPHRRARVFILGKPRSSRLSTRRHREREYEVHHPKEWSTTEIEQQWRVGQPGSSEGSEALVNSRSEGSQGSHDHGESSDRLQQSASERCGYVDESSSNERQRQVQEHADRSIPPLASDDGHKVTVNSGQAGLIGDADRFHGRPIQTALSGDESLKHDPTLPRLNPKFVEWLMGWPVDWLELTDFASSETE
jgi:DNA-cytosine methyltransferase